MADLIKKYNKPVPRYTSYPTAPHFHADIDADIYSKWLGSFTKENPISLYFHIPFCEKLCWYCGCHTKIVNQYDSIHAYVKSLLKEIDLVHSYIGHNQPVSHIHWGGGTPSILNLEDFEDIFNKIHTSFEVLPNAEIAIEVDPRTLTKDKVKAMASAGINRASMGVQDFNKDVQEAINRVQPLEMTKQTIDWLKDAGIENINFDLIYGLPLQTMKKIEYSIKRTLELAPDRIAVFGYAHVPWMKQHQKLLEKYDIPNGEQRNEFFTHITQMLTNANYVAIGYDHFACKNDTMTKALNNHSLKRNFQGYTIDPANALVGFGASSISCLPQGYTQNETSIRLWRNMIEEGNLATKCGIKTSNEDNFRRRLIEEVMCYYEVDIDKIAQEMGFSTKTLSSAMEKLYMLQKDNLIELNNSHIHVTKQGEPFIRVIAACFDTYHNPSEKKHAKAV